MAPIVIGGALAVGSYFTADLAGFVPGSISIMDRMAHVAGQRLLKMGSVIVGQDSTQNINATQNFNATAMGEWFAQYAKDFFQGAGYKDGGGVGGFLASALLNETKNFTDTAGLDPAKASEKLTQILRNVIIHLDVGQLTAEIKEKLHDVIENLDLNDLIQHLTDDLGKVLTTALRNIGGQVLLVATFELLPIVLLGLAAAMATPLAIYWVYRRALHKIGTPKLATEIHQHTILTPLTERVKNATASYFGYSRKQKKPVFSPKITRRVDELIASTQNIRKNGGYFQHVLFYGPGGTGKTLISEYIAKNSGMSYIKMSGGDLAQYIKRGEHVTELNRLFDKMNLSWRPWSTRPWILYIDEAESLCRDRATIPTPELLELQNALLNRTGTESSKFMLIFSTNLVSYLDEAVLTRIDHKIYIGPPAEPERVRILQSYIPQFFSADEQERFFKPPQVQRIAKATPGFPGRSLFKLLNTISNKKASSANRLLTQAMIDQSVIDLVSAEREIEKRRALKDAPPVKRPSLTLPPAPPEQTVR
jgi:MoxR-like ATPase